MTTRPNTLPPLEEQLEAFRRGGALIEPEEELKTKLARGKPLRIKLGVDPTSPDLHLGHTVPLMKLKALQEMGHRIDFIIGSFTALIGDPTGRSKTRPPLTPEEVENNARTYTEQAARFLDPDLTNVVHNEEWLAPMSFADVVRLSGAITVARLIERDDFQKRFSEGNPIHLHEFLYPLMQGFDSVHLESDVEVGGTDQRFNILAARQFQQYYGQKPQVGLFLPILTGLDGKLKMSKSYGNYIGVTESPLDMYSKVLSLPDEPMEEWFTLLTDLPAAEIEAMKDPETGLLLQNPKAAKKRLARLIATTYHGPEEAARVQSEWEEIHEKRTGREVPSDTPTVRLPPEAFKAGGKVFIVELVDRLGFTMKRSGKQVPISRSEIRRVVEQGGLYVDGEKVSDPQADVVVKEGTVVRIGTKQYRRVGVG